MPNVLVIGSGGREQALAWKLAQSPSVDKVYIAPGNGGSQGKISNVDIAFDDVDGLLKFAQDNTIDLSVVGQEASSEAGVVDAFKEAGLRIFGPTKAAVRIESSKAFSKELMASQNIPTAEFRNLTDPEEARKYAKSRNLPVVLKADGLAGGKGVLICKTTQEIDTAIEEIMVKKVFGDSGNKIVVEDFLRGQEASFHALCDGKNSVIFPVSQDHKQIYDGDKGPNTGGIGAYAPVDWVSPDQIEFVNQKVVQPALSGLRKQGADFTGCLYPGLMIEGEEIKVLEFNARFGDPEAEVYMRLLDSDLYEILIACVDGKLNPEMVKWKSGYAVSVVLTSPGYPGTYPKGLPISGVEDAAKQDDIVVFHSFTRLREGKLETNGGRVLNVTAIGPTLNETLDKAYAAIKLINFEGMHYRTDIGHRSAGRD